MSSAFYAFCGHECSGKTTTMEAIKAEVEKRGIADRFEFVKTMDKETKMGKAVRSIRLDSSVERCPERDLFLILADRAHLIQTKIKPALEAGKIVFIDRWVACTAIYEFAVNGADASLTDLVLNQAEQVPLNKYFIPFCKVDTIFERLATRDGVEVSKDIYDSQGWEFHAKVHNLYMKDWRKILNHSPQSHFFDTDQLSTQWIANTILSEVLAENPCPTLSL